MSQYPYQPPQPPMSYGYGYYPQDPVAALLAPARRASILMFVFGGLGVLLGACLAGVIPALPLEQSMQQQGMTLPPGQTLESFRSQAVLSGIIFLVVSVVYIVLGVFVRRASKGAAITGIVLSILGIAYLALSIVAVFLVSSQGGGPGGAALGACFAMFPLALFVWLVVWLSQAVGAINRLRQWGFQGQAQQGYGAYAGGYAQGPIYPSQQPQTWQQPGVGPWGQQQAGWGQQGPPVPPPPPPPPSDREG